jgi:hypothetical protein
MPLTEKGRKVKKAVEKTYGKKRGEKVFYAMENKGEMKGLTKKMAMGGMATYGTPSTMNTMQQQKTNQPNMGMAYGGMAKKGYAKGGYANCGASMKPAQKSTPKK